MLAKRLWQKLRNRGQAALPTKLKYSDWADGAAYVLTGVAAYGDFASHNPQLAYYIGVLGAGFFILSNWLASKGD